MTIALGLVLFPTVFTLPVDWTPNWTPETFDPLHGTALTLWQSVNTVSVPG